MKYEREHIVKAILKWDVQVSFKPILMSFFLEITPKKIQVRFVHTHVQYGSYVYTYARNRNSIAHVVWIDLDITSDIGKYWHVVHCLSIYRKAYKQEQRKKKLLPPPLLTEMQSIRHPMSTTSIAYAFDFHTVVFCSDLKRN